MSENHKTPSLHAETEAARNLRAMFADLIGDDEEVAADIVEGETNLNEAIDLAVQQLADDTAAIKGINDYIEKFTARKERLKRRVDHLRTALAVAMEQAGKKTHTHPAVTLSLKNVPASVVLTDEALVPSQFWVAQDPKLDKKAILAALKDKKDVAGATLSNGGKTISLRWG